MYRLYMLNVDQQIRTAAVQVSFLLNALLILLEKDLHILVIEILVALIVGMYCLISVF